MTESKQLKAGEYSLNTPYYDDDPTKNIVIETIHDTCQKIIGDIAGKKEEHRVYSGIEFIDKEQLGFSPEDYIIIAARPSVGKTSFVTCHMILKQLKRGLKVGFFSCEMTKEKVIKIMACSLAGVDTNRFELNMLTNVEQERVIKAM